MFVKTKLERVIEDNTIDHLEAHKQKKSRKDHMRVGSAIAIVRKNWFARVKESNYEIAVCFSIAFWIFKNTFPWDVAQIENVALSCKILVHCLMNQTCPCLSTFSHLWFLFIFEANFYLPFLYIKGNIYFLKSEEVSRIW